MHDTVIRGGTIVDGTGQAAFTGDVALKDGKIAQVGGKAGPAKRDIDASVPSWMLIHWTRDRSRGPKLPLEKMVKRQTSETADFFGFHDRGRLAVGKKADVNVIGYQALRLHIPEVRYDLPMNGRRLAQRVDGYRNTFMSSVSTFENGVYTDAKAGRLVRASAA